jgi:hypothetical protein
MTPPDSIPASRIGAPDKPGIGIDIVGKLPGQPAQPPAPNAVGGDNLVNTTRQTVSDNLVSTNAPGISQVAQRRNTLHLKV